MNDNDAETERQQLAVCSRYGQTPAIPEPNSKLDFALGTIGKAPINGLRHAIAGDSNGWYIWCGEDLSQSADFFSPIHSSHLKERCAEALPFLGLPPGFRFLVAAGYVDVWYDPQLLKVD